MCNTPRYSESGKPCGVQRCEEYEVLKQERDYMEALKDEIIRERDVAERALELMRQEAADWRSAKYIAEQKETAVHLALNDMREERDALLKVREAADALADEVACELSCSFEKDVNCKKCKMDDLCTAYFSYKEARDGNE